MWQRRRGLRRYDPMRGLKGLGLLIVVLAAAYLGVVAITSVERIRRTAEAPVQIDARRPFTTVSTFGTAYLGGRDVSYSYEVDGRTYRSTARRPWPDFDAYEPKVCFAPANPGDHWLVAGTYPCGSVWRPASTDPRRSAGRTGDDGSN